MPQLDFSLYISQIFWTIISFGVFYVSLKYFVLNKVEGIQVARSTKNQKMLDNISDMEQKLESIASEISEIKKLEIKKTEKIRSEMTSILHELRASLESEYNTLKEEKMSEYKQDIKDYSKSIASVAEEISKTFATNVKQYQQKSNSYKNDKYVH